MPSIVLELMQGGSLHDLLHNADRSELATLSEHAAPALLPAKLLRRVALEVASGITYLHDNKVIHRDIKSANVLLDDQRHAKVTDFGISTRYGREHTAETGTYRYMAPEVITHQSYDHLCDVYSFGVLLWEILHQHIPFLNQKPLQAAFAVAMAKSRPEIKLRSELQCFGDLIAQCWHDVARCRPEMSQVVQQIVEMDSGE